MNCQPDSIFFREEIRNGFLVTEKMKKIWYTEISLLQELDRVCKKNTVCVILQSMGLYWGQ